MLKMIIIMNFQHLFCLNNEKSWSGNVFKHHLMHAECNGPQRVRNLKFVLKNLDNRFFSNFRGYSITMWTLDKKRGEGVSRKSTFGQVTKDGNCVKCHNCPGGRG